MKTFLPTITALLLVIAVAANASAQGAGPPTPPPAPAAGTTDQPPPATPTPTPPASEVVPAPPPELPVLIRPPATASPIQAAAAASPPPAAPASAGGGPGPVERLPPSAYPEEFTRGIYGGSLWSIFHGAQWPYYPRTGIGASGYVWLDNSYERINVGLPSAQYPATTDYLQQGRFLLRVTPTYSAGSVFVQAQAELVVNKDQSQSQMSVPSVADADDVWLRIGQWRRWDVMVGRFEAFEIYHRGMGLDINTLERVGAFDGTNSPPDIYGATFLFDRPSRPGNAAIHIYPFRYLRIELLAQYGGFGPFNQIGARPAVVFDIGWLKLKAAQEYQRLTAHGQGDQTEQRNRGFAVSAQLVFAPWVEGGVNYGYWNNRALTSNGNPDTLHTGELSSVGFFLNARVIDALGTAYHRLTGRPSWRQDLIVGIGYNYVANANDHINSQTGFGDFATNKQAFVAVQYLVLKQVFVKLVGAYAKSDFDQAFNTTGPYADTMYSVRLRLLYLF